MLMFLIYFVVITGALLYVSLVNQSVSSWIRALGFEDEMIIGGCVLIGLLLGYLLSRMHEGFEEHKELSDEERRTLEFKREEILPGQYKNEDLPPMIGYEDAGRINKYANVEQVREVKSIKIPNPEININPPETLPPMDSNRTWLSELNGDVVEGFEYPNEEMKEASEFNTGCQKCGEPMAYTSWQDFWKAGCQ
jgi:hypothetical protein